MDSITSDEMRIIEDKAEKLGISKLILMENAGNSIVNYIKKNIIVNRKKIIIISGTGNNGGDGLVAARHLACEGGIIYVILIGNPKKIKNEAKVNWDILIKMGKTVNIIITETCDELANFSDLIKHSDIILDALLGTGIRGELKTIYKYVINLINKSKAFKISIDIPTGMDPNTGIILDKIVKPDVTITFHKIKKGLLVNKSQIGKLIVNSIGIPKNIDMP